MYCLILVFFVPIYEYRYFQFDNASAGKIKKELNLLQKLYTLYNTVIQTVNGYYDILWLDIDIEKINDELTDFQNRSAVTRCKTGVEIHAL